MTTILSRDGTRLLSGVESAEQRLRDALSIRRGSYPWSRDYGSRLDVDVDRLLDPAAEARIYAAVAEAVAHPPNGLGDVTLREVRLHQDPAYPDRAEVEVDAEWRDANGRITPIGVRQALTSPGRRDIWDPALPLGEVSRVYLRRHGVIRETYLDWVFSPSRLPDEWVESDGGAVVASNIIWLYPPPRSINLSISLTAVGAEARYRHDPGPHLRQDILSWLALLFRPIPEGDLMVLRFRAFFTTDPTDPYLLALPRVLSDRLYRWAVRNAGKRMMVALVLLDPGSPVDLSDATTAAVAGALELP